MPATIWITGASGFSARHLITALRRSEPDSRLVGLARRPGASADLDVCHVADLNDGDALIRAAQADPPDRIYHLAGAVHPASEAQLWFTNVAGTRRLIEAVSGGPARRVRLLVTSSAAVYRSTNQKVGEQHPAGGANAYGRSKWGQEQIALAAGREFGVEVLIARAFNLIGPGLPDRLLAGAVCARCANATNGRIETGDLSAFRDFIDIRDACAAYLLLMNQGEPEQIYNVASGEATPVRTLVETLAELAGGLKIDEILGGNRRGVDRSWGNNAKLCQLGWTPVYSLRDSLKDMLSDARR